MSLDEVKVDGGDASSQSPAAADPATLAKDAENAAIEERRAKAQLPDLGEERWGLALSGGGVRSATFCLGAVRALARQGLLRRFDYLSTVSGGGYLGSSVGRLFGAGSSAKQVEEGIARPDSLWLWWLRANGRYLTPAGAKDLTFAAASIIRGVIATYVEITTLILLLVAVILIPHLIVTVGATLKWPLLKLSALSVFGSAWWWLLVVPAFVYAQQSVAFWCSVMSRNSRSLWWTLLAATVLAILGSGVLGLALSQYLAFGPGQPDKWPQFIAINLFAGLLSFAPVLGALEVLVFGNDNYTRKNVRRTSAQATALTALGSLFVLGLFDWASWAIADWYRRGGLSVPSYGVAFGATAIVTVLRLAMPQIKEALAKAQSRHFNIERALNLLGVACLLMLVLIWTTVIHAFIVPTELWDGTLTADKAFRKEFLCWAYVVAIPLFYVMLSCRHYSSLNFSSLHEFYRARIETAYVASGNASTRFGGDPLRKADAASKNAVAPLLRSLDADDIDMADYAPHREGGPIHIVNCCINQSIDDRTESYNADRKGVALGISALGVEVGTAAPQPPPAGVRLGPLSRWVAVSGAAASTGMGSATSPGLAALLFLSGLRLGYWTPRLREPQLNRRPTRWVARGTRRLFEAMPKPVAIVAEAMARFPGLDSPAWYLSDGGHFDNTAIYPLLKRQVDVIIAADCGADPNYLFSDIESLVRKARLDYSADIAFYQRPDAAQQPLLGELIESPESMNASTSTRCLVVGRITYAGGKIGTLIVLKPRRLEEMPFDVVAYADREPQFPQQSTADQWFDEAQWESYHRLGNLIGERVTTDVIAQAIALTHSTSAEPTSLSSVADSSGANVPARRERASPAVRASIGLGVLASVVIALWQGFQGWEDHLGADKREFLVRLKQIREAVSKADWGAVTSSELGSLAGDSERYDAAPEYAALLHDLQKKCDSLAEGSEERSDCDRFNGSTRQPPVHRYWLDDIRVASTESPIDIAPPTYIPIIDVEPHAQLDYSDLSLEGPDCMTTWTPECSAAIQKYNGTYLSGVQAAGTPSEPKCLPDQAKAVTIYVQIYDEDTRKPAEELLKQATGNGFVTPGVENVVISAERRGAQAPYVWTKPSLLFHAGVSDACMEQVQRTFALNDASISASKGAPGVVELWLPPRWQK